MAAKRGAWRSRIEELPGARRAAPPRELAPQLATLVRDVPSGDEWLHEIKHDGYRLLCFLAGGKAALLTRRGHDWTGKFPALAREAERLPVETAVLDGEAVVVRADGRSDFQALQNAIATGDHPRLVYYLFDLVHCEGYDLRRAPLERRKELLRAILASSPETRDRLRYSDHVRGHGRAVWEKACNMGVEGIVSKIAVAPYSSRRTRTWLKIKCAKRQEFVIAGWTDPAGARTGFGSLLLGYYEPGGRLVFCGQVGTGFTDPALREILDLLRDRSQRDPPFAAFPRALRSRRVHWVRPELVAEVEFTDWTEDGRLRHPSFKGLRFDKDPREIRREAPA